MGNSSTSHLELYYHGNFITLDANTPNAIGMIVEGTKIKQLIATPEELKIAQKSISKQIDLNGQTIIPGFVLSHLHLCTYSYLSQNISVSPMNLYFDPNYVPPTSSEEVLQRLSQQVPPEGLGAVFVQGYDPLLQPGNVITRLDLDTISSTQAIYLMTASMHNFYVNTQALINAGVVETINPDGSIVLNNKVPDHLKPEVEQGFLCEKAMMIVAASFPTIRMDNMMECLTSASHILNRRGITTVGDATVPDLDFSLYRDYSRMDPHLRIVGFPIYAIQSPWLTLAHGTCIRTNFKEYLTNDYLYVGPMKIVADGALEGYTAYLTEPYITPPFFSVPDPSDWRGEPEFPAIEIEYAFENILRSGMRIAIHGNGDAIIDIILNAFEKAQNKYPVSDHRTRIEHCTTARPDQLDRMQQLGIHPSFLMHHVYYYGDIIKDQLLGPERAERIDPVQDVIDRNMICDFHSDSPVTPPDPLFLIWTAVNRLTQSGSILGPEQRVTVEEALKMVTINSAYTLGIDSYVGSLSPGKFADFVVLAQNILIEKDIKDIQISATYLGGKLVI